jgi:hypothetical protein
MADPEKESISYLLIGAWVVTLNEAWEVFSRSSGPSR